MTVRKLVREARDDPPERGEAADREQLCETGVHLHPLVDTNEGEFAASIRPHDDAEHRYKERDHQVAK